MGDIFRFCTIEIKSVCDEWGIEYELYPKGKGDRPFPHFIIRGRVIYLISTEDVTRFSGFEIGHVWIDEAAKIKTSSIDPLKDAPTQIRSRIRCPLAKTLQCILSTTPEGQETWIQDFFIDNPRPNHRRYEGSTDKNKEVPQEYIDDLKASIPAHLIDQYIHGKAASIVAGIAHPIFSMENVSDKADWMNTTIHIGMDFNVKPMCWVALQIIGDKIHVVDEMFIEDYALVDNAMEEINMKNWGRHKVVFHPDKAACQRSTTGDSEFNVIMQKARGWNWNWSGDANGSNPPINNRINNLSRLLLNALGERRLLIHPRCTHLIEDLQRTTRKKSGGYDDGKDGKRGHILDALGYALWDTFSAQSAVTMATIGS